MQFLISGASGFIGSNLTKYLEAAGHAVRRLVRAQPRSGNEVHWDPAQDQLDPQAFGGVNVVINLNGVGLADKRWSSDYRRLIIDSRVQSTSLLARVMAALDHPPQVFISQSAVGWYGYRDPDEDVDESSEPGSSFIAEVAHKWEAAADPARQAGIRTVHPRCGVVIGPGGALKQMLPPFRLGLGGKLGSGEQAFSWIALDDYGPALLHVVAHDELSGAVNFTAPDPVSNEEFAHLLGAALGKPSFAAVPPFVLRMAVGDLAEELLHGQRVLPKKLLGSGYQFLYTCLRDALTKYVTDL